MKERVITSLLVCVLLFTTSLPAIAATQVKDISSSHWAYQSVKELVGKGYMSLYEGNKFKGEDKVSRYELAEVVAEVLSNIEKGQVVPEKGDVLTLKSLATEFRSELVEVVSQSEDLKYEIKDIAKEQKVLKEDVVNTNYRLNQLQQEVANILLGLKEEAEKIKQLEEEVQFLKKENEVLRNEINSAGSQAELESLNKKFYWLTGGWILSVLLLANN